MTIGFSTGDYNLFFKESLDRFSQKFMGRLILADAKAIEINYRTEELLDYLLMTNNLNLTNFDFVSIHAHPHIFDDDEDTRRILDKFGSLKAKYSITNFVFHASWIKNWELLNRWRNLPVSIENMDQTQTFGKTIADIGSILEKYDFGLTLDLQHCYVNDASMALADEMQRLFKTRIVEYHLSAFNEKLTHGPLFAAGQDEIIKSLQFKDKPIIIESVFEALGDHVKELNHIKQKLVEYENQHA